MAYKLLAFFAFLSVVSAAILPEQYHHHEQASHHAAAYPAPVIHHHQPHHQLEHEHDAYDHHPKYQFHYDVNDHLTYDTKSQTESRDGDVVQGEYTVHDPDGFLRVVKYTVDPHSGFQAVVQRQPLDKKFQDTHHAPPHHSHSHEYQH